MSLLDEIRDGAIMCGADFDTALRRAYLLATRLGYEPFQAWVTSELRGYANDAELPSYRTVNTSITYEAISGYTRQRGTATWDMFHGDDKARESASKLGLRIGAAELVSWASKADDVRVMPSAYVHHHLATQFERQGFYLLSARQVIPEAAIRRVQSEICTSLLQFVTEIEKLYPEAGNERLPHTSETERVIGTVFNQVIVHGGSPSFSVASGINPVAASVAIEQKVILAGELTNLLRSEGLEIDNLAEVFDDATVEEVDQPDSGVGQWIGRAIEAGKKAGKLVTEEVLKAAVRQVITGQFDPSIVTSLFG